MLHDFKLKVKFFAATDVREIELPKLSREAKGWPALVKISYPFDPERAPEICQADVRGQRFQLRGRVKRKGRACRNKAREGIAVEVVAVRWIGGPVRV